MTLLSRISVACLLAFTLASCRKNVQMVREYRVLEPLPPVPVSVIEDAPPPINVIRTLPVSAVAKAAPLNPYELPRYEAKKPRIAIFRKPKKAKPVVVNSPKPDPPEKGPIPDETTTQPTIELGDVMTNSQRGAELGVVDQILGETTATLARLEGRALSERQRQQYEQSQNFAARARGFRQTDLAAAKAFAERARVLARELAQQVK
jgi:hypothetical protein